MSTTIYSDTTHRHDFVLLFEVTDGNPNGDPDAGNLPRVDPETMQGLVTDVCLKRKVRNYVDVVRGCEGRFKIYVQDTEALNNMHQRAYDALGIVSTGTKQARDEVARVRAWMCQNFYDIRFFGAVMTTGVNCGQVRGAMQLTFGRSIDPIVPINLSITRIAITRPEDMAVAVGEEGTGKGGKTTEMGRKPFVPYGLYRAHGFFNPHLAKQTGVDDEDLELFWEALRNMWAFDRSASRGMMASRELCVFSHGNAFGNAPAHELFDRLTVTRRPEVSAPRRYSDYLIRVDSEGLPEGVTLSRLI